MRYHAPRLAAFVLAVAAIGPASHAGSCIEFAEQVTYNAPGRPWFISSGDLDGDGDVDIATTSQLFGQANVLLNNGDGTFGQVVQYPTGGVARAMAMGDVDGDGDLDLAVANSNTGPNALVILPNNGDGTFAPFVPWASTTSKTEVMLGDLDGDDDLDVGMVDNFQESVSIRLNNGDGTFGAETTYDVGANAAYLGFVDVDTDGDLDTLVSTFFPSQLVTLENDGTGTFSNAGRMTVDAGPIVSADVDDDGDTDVVVTTSPRVLLLVNDGGTLGAPLEVYSSFGTSTSSSVFGDVDDDGDPDLVVTLADDDDVLSVLRNDGAGTFTFETSVVAGAWPRYATIADFDGDDKADVACGNFNDGNVSVFINTCPDTPVRNVTQGSSWTGIQVAIDAADSGDELRIDPGVYDETIDFGAKELRIFGETGDPADVEINGQGAGPVVRIAGGQTAASAVSGVTILGGVAPSGGGILIDGAAPDIVNCIVVLNMATATGGGIAVRNAPAGPRIIGCLIEGNTAPSGEGGGLFLDLSEAYVGSTTVRDNLANGGGGVYLAGGSTLLTEQSVYDFNTANFDGSAILNQGGDVEMNSCLLASNTGNGAGGAAFSNLFESDAIITNATFAGNTGNTVGAIHDLASTTLVSNSIIFGNTPTRIASFGGGLTVNHSLLSGAWDGPGTGNIVGDPLFADVMIGDYRLLDGSPCLDAGDNGAPRVFFLDLDAAPRIEHCRVDMGAYESIFFADCNGNGIGDACDVAPIVNPEFDQQIGGWELVLDNGEIVIDGGIVTITGASDDSGDRRTGVAQSIPGEAAVVTFVLLSYESDDDDDCSSGGGSYDFPFFVVNDLFFPLNQDGSLAPPVDGTSCLQSGTITNQDPPPAPVTFVVDLVDLVGPGPYLVGVGVATVDSLLGPGVAVYDALGATTGVLDTNGDGVPDECGCPGDVDLDGEVGFEDLLAVLFRWGVCAEPCPEDLDGDGEVGFADLLIVLFEWGACG